MFSIETAEIRWFHPGNLPAELIHWLSLQKGEFEEQAPRTDSYLIAEPRESMGIKLREGRLELKKRLGSQERYDYKGISGRVESWKKWSMQLTDELPAGNISLRDPTHWIDIRKTRYLQKYEITAAGKLIPPPRTGFPLKGIAVELSGLLVNGNDWWTFGLECFGNTGENIADLLRAIPSLVAGFPATGLDLCDSSGYPEWINGLIKKP